jgi:O-antigen/teichoic acid export membrane protein
VNLADESTGDGAASGNVRSRAFWIAADQVLSSLSNVSLSLLLAISVSPLDYGGFALTFSIYAIVLYAVQALGGQVLLVHYGTAPLRDQRRKAAQAASIAGTIGVVVGILMGIAGLMLGSPLQSMFLVMAAALPFLLIQDVWRSAFFARGLPKSAFCNDLAWIGMQGLGIALLVWLGVTQGFLYVAAWSLGGAFAAVLGFRQNHHGPVKASIIRWVHVHRDVTLPSLGHSLAGLGFTQVAVVLVAWTASVQDVGALRGAQTVLGPLALFGMAVTGFAISEVGRQTLSRSKLLRVGISVGTAHVLISLGWSAFLLLMPDSIGSALLGETWPAARLALPGMALYSVLLAAGTGAYVIFIATNRTYYALSHSVVLGPLVVVCSVIGAAVGGAASAALGFALAAAISVPLAWWFLARAARQGKRSMLPTPSASPLRS